MLEFSCYSQKELREIMNYLAQFPDISVSHDYVNGEYIVMVTPNPSVLAVSEIPKQIRNLLTISR